MKQEEKKKTLFDGRITNVGWYPWFVAVVVAIAGGNYMVTNQMELLKANALLTLILAGAQFWFLFCYIIASVKRLHDMGLPGWYIIITVPPFLPTQMVFAIALGATPSVREDNEYGPGPGPLPPKL